MKPTTLNSVKLIALLALCGTSAAHADDVYVLPAPAAAEVVAADQQRAAVEARALAERRSRMIDRCVANHGYEEDCIREVDTELRAEGSRVVHLRAPH
jgi:hypothetical protein